MFFCAKLYSTNTRYSKIENSARLLTVAYAYNNNKNYYYHYYFEKKYVPSLSCIYESSLGPR